MSSFEQSFYPGFVEGPFGVPMAEQTARAVETITKDASSDDVVFKRAFAHVKLSNELRDDDRADISIISTATLDRDFEVVLPDGIDNRNYKHNPVVTFAHKYDMLPVGKSVWQRYDRSLGAFKAKTAYAPRPKDFVGEWLPDTVFAMIQAGMLPGKSIGFVPVPGEFGPPTNAEVKAMPSLANARRVFRKVMLLEYAVAPIPANPDAVVEAIGKGLVTKSMAERMGFDVPERIDLATSAADVTTSDDMLAAARTTFDGVDVSSMIEDRVDVLLGRV